MSWELSGVVMYLAWMLAKLEEPDDPLEVPYIRKRLRCVRIVGRFHLLCPIG